MVIKLRSAVMFCCLCIALTRLCEAQSLSPRAYVTVPVHSNAVTLTYSLNAGNVVFNDLPVTNSSGRIGSEIASYFHTFDCFGRSANVTVLLPYEVGHFKGDVNGVHEEIYRSGIGAVAARVSVNLFGAPAMNLEEFRRWKQKTVLGASLTVQTPTGQYDGVRLINIGQHRWAFKPELGFCGGLDIGCWTRMGQRGSTRPTTISFRMHRARQGLIGRRRSRWGRWSCI